MTTSNDSQLLTAVRKNFKLDTTDVADWSLSRFQYDI